MKVSALILKELFEDSQLVQEPAEFVDHVVTHLWEHADAKSVAVVLQDLDPTHEVLAVSARGLSGQSMLSLAGFRPPDAAKGSAMPAPMGDGAVYSVVPLTQLHQRLTLIADGETDPDALVLVANLLALAVERSQALRSAERLIQLFNRGPVVLFRRRNAPEWPIAEVSANVTREFGWPVDSLLGHSSAALVHPEDLARVRDEMKTALDQGAPYTAQSYRMIDAAGVTREIFEFTHFIRDDAGALTHMHGYLFDDGDRRRSERQKAARLEALQQSRKIEAIGTLASGIAHDLNNVLAVVLTSLELARLDPAVASADTDLTAATEAALKGRDMVRQLLVFGRSTAAAHVPRRLQQVIQDAMRQVHPILPEAIALHVALDPDAPLVLADATQIEQLLINLVTNAVAAMPHGGTLDIRLRAVPYPRDHVELEVRDTGEGMTAEVLARAFEPFFTTKPVGKGVGLGLAMVDTITRKHGGTVTLESKPGLGTIVVVSLPCAEQQKPTDEPVRSTPRKVATVAVVDDEPEVARSTSRLVAHFGYEVTAFAGGLALLKSFEGNPHAFGLVVTDYRMPEMTGLELGQRLRAAGIDVPVLLVTGLPSEIDLTAISAPFAVLGKPYRLEELREALASLLQPTRSSGQPDGR